MTGRRLYDHLCDALAVRGAWSQGYSVLFGHSDPVAWPYLSAADRSVLNDLARKIAPARKKKA